MIKGTKNNGVGLAQCALVTWPGAPVAFGRCCCHVLSRESGKWHLVNVGTCVGTTETWLEVRHIFQSYKSCRRCLGLEMCYLWGYEKNKTLPKTRITPRHHWQSTDSWRVQANCSQPFTVSHPDFTLHTTLAWSPGTSHTWQQSWKRRFVKISQSYLRHY